MEPTFLNSDKWERKKDCAQMEIKIYSITGAILYEMYENGTRVFFNHSPRPYVLGQFCDGTIDDCVFTLFYDFCQRSGLCPDTLYNTAYPDTSPRSEEDRKFTIKRGNAEGVTLPDTWDDQAFDGLIESLTAINNHSLVGVLMDIKEKGKIS